MVGRRPEWLRTNRRSQAERVKRNLRSRRKNYRKRMDHQTIVSSRVRHVLVIWWISTGPYCLRVRSRCRGPPSSLCEKSASSTWPVGRFPIQGTRPLRLGSVSRPHMSSFLAILHPIEQVAPRILYGWITGIAINPPESSRVVPSQDDVSPVIARFVKQKRTQQVTGRSVEPLNLLRMQQQR